MWSVAQPNSKLNKRGYIDRIPKIIFNKKIPSKTFINYNEIPKKDINLQLEDNREKLAILLNTVGKLHIYAL